MEYADIRLISRHYIAIVNDIKNFVFGPAKAPVYGFGRNRKQKFVMSFTIFIGATSLILINKKRTDRSKGT